MENWYQDLWKVIYEEREPFTLNKIQEDPITVNN